MTENNFLKNMLYNTNSHSISIIFKERMTSSNKVDSYLLPINYAIKIDNQNPISLSKYSNKVYSYDNRFITFYLKPEYYYLIDNIIVNPPTKVYCGYTSLNKLYYVSSENNIIQDICKYIVLEKNKESFQIQFTDCYVSSISKNSISIEAPYKTYFGNIYLYDFYFIDKNNITISPTSHKRDSDSKITLFFDTSIENVTNLYASLNCKSLDAFGLNIKGGYKNIVNNIPSTLNKVSVSSHNNGVLSLIASVTNEVLRYDGMDFEVLINNKTYPCTGKSSYSPDNLLRILANNIYDFNFSNNAILLRSKNNPSPYTLDKKRKSVLDLVGAFAEFFSAESGRIYYPDSTDSGSIKVLINFNKFIGDFPVIPNGNLTTNCPSNDCNNVSFSINNIGTLMIFGKNLKTTDSSYNIELSKYENILTITIKLDNTHTNFILSNKNNIDFINFTPVPELKSLDGIFAFITFEAPILIDEKTTTLIEPGGWNNNYNGTTFDGSLILEVNKNNTNRTFGSISTNATIIKGDLLIKQIIDNPINTSRNNLVTINNFNVEGYIYFLTNGDFDLSLANSSCNILIIKEEQ